MGAFLFLIPLSFYMMSLFIYFSISLFLYFFSLFLYFLYSLFIWYSLFSYLPPFLPLFWLLIPLCLIYLDPSCYSLICFFLIMFLISFFILYTSFLFLFNTLLLISYSVKWSHRPDGRTSPLIIWFRILWILMICSWEDTGSTPVGSMFFFLYFFVSFLS